MRLKAILGLAVMACLVLVTVPAQSATRAQIGAKCRAAWTGSTATAAFRAYRTRCIRAATAAISDATDAGNPTSRAADTRRSRKACGRQFPSHASGAGRKAFNACVKAANNSQRAFAGRPLHATLKGANEVPPAGGASGTASIRLNQGKGRVCVTLTFTGGATPIFAHIHKDRAGHTGPVVVSLSSAAIINALAAGKPGRGCFSGVDRALIKDIRQHPADYYVNIHDTANPNGAARGQLHK
jgi:CHRD domain